MSSAELVEGRARLSTAPAGAVPVAVTETDPSRSREWILAAAYVSFRLALVLALAICLAGPWMNQQLYWLGWIGLGGFLYFHRYLVQRPAVLWTLLYATAALGIAFHWAPAAMAYTIDGSLLLGTLIVVPILVVEVVRLALPFLLVHAALPARVSPASLENDQSARPFVTKLAAVPRWILLATFAVALETLVPTVFPWRLGYLQGGAPVLNQSVSVFGPAISTFSVFALAAVVCGMAVHARRMLGRSGPPMPTVARENKELWTAGTLIGLNLLWGAGMLFAWDRRDEPANACKMALVQVDPSYTDSLDKMRRFTRQTDDDVNLVCWPESSIGCYSIDLTDFTDRKHLLRNSRPPLLGVAPMKSPNREILAGGRSYAGPRRGDGLERVSAYLIDRQERIVDRYHKTRLMPFGEYVPGAQIIPGLTTLFGFGEHPPLPGASPRALTTSSGHRLGAMMCYEDMIPAVSRDLVRDGAQVLMVLINGTAFESPYALLQHRQLACFRALENRRYLIRTASTGSTCVIDPLGRVVDELPPHTEGMLQAEIELFDGRTPFSQTGDILGWTCVFAGVVIVGQTIRRRRLGR